MERVRDPKFFCHFNLHWFCDGDRCDCWCHEIQDPVIKPAKERARRIINKLWN
jgi:hypothetical protein